MFLGIERVWLAPGCFAKVSNRIRERAVIVAILLIAVSGAEDGVSGSCAMGSLEG